MGILLVAVGIMLLISELKGLNGAAMVMRWWPVILVILGMEILAFILFSREEQPKIKFDGLSIFLTVFIVLVSSAVYGVNTFFQSEFSHSVLGEIGFYGNESVINQTYDLDAAGVKKLQLSNSSGQVQIDRYEGDQIKVDVAMVIRSNDKEEALKLAEDMIEVTEGETVSILTRNAGLPGNNRNYEVNVHYAIKVPNRMDYDIHNQYGEIMLEDLLGNVQVEGQYGRVEAKNIQGDVRIQNSFGDTNVQDISGKVEIDSEQGQVTIGSRKMAENLISVNSDMGDITLELASDQTGSFEAVSQFGEITWEGFKTALPIHSEDTRQSLQGTLGNALPVISLHADNGSIRLIGR